jgi:hypothetical protein
VTHTGVASACSLMKVNFVPEYLSVDFKVVVDHISTSPVL